MSQLALSLLGSFQVTRNGQPVHGFRVKTAQALLAYLAVEADRPHQRETLAGLLWPDVPNTLALNNLRHTLSNLRQAIGDFDAVPILHITRHTLHFNPANGCVTDVAAFQAGANSPDLARQAQAIDLYHGLFLDGFSLNTSPAFEEWLLVRQQQYARLAVDTLQQLAQGHIQRGDYAQAQRYAQRLLDLEPWHEAAHSLMIQLHTLNGRRTEALAQYETYRRLMQQELGVPPAPELTAQYDRLRTGQTPPPPTRSILPDNPARADLSAARSPFVARDTELARLAAALSAARQGPGQICFIIGEAGSGKTSLIDEFTRQAMSVYGDVLVAGGACSAHSGPGEPYLPLCEIVQLLTGDIEAKRAGGAISPEHARRLWDSLPDTLQALVEHAPDLIGTFVRAETLALRAEVFSSSPSRWQARLTELAQRPAPANPPDLLAQFMALLHALTRTRTLILVLDDLQWADEATLNWLFYAGRHLIDQHCLIIGAYRPTDVALGRAGQRHPLEAVVNELQRHVGEAPLNLDRSPGRAFIDALLDTEPNTLSADFRDTLYQHTSGHPLFTVELIRDLKARGEWVRDAAGCWTAGPALDWQQLPARVEAIIAERINRVPDHWQPLLEAACVEGDEFTAEIIAEVIGLEVATVTQALSGELNHRYQLVTATRLERQGARRLTHYRFRHQLFERYLYQRLEAVMRAELHEAIGAALERHYSDQPANLNAITPQLARHFEAAGLALKAADYWRQAGQRAMRLSAYTEAHVVLTRGLALLTAVPASPERVQCELSLQLALGHALAPQGWSTVDRARVFDRAYELALQTGTTVDFLRAIYALADLAQGQGELTRAIGFGQELLRLIQQTGGHDHIIPAQYIIGTSYCFLGQFAVACQHLDRVLALTETTANDLMIGPGQTDLQANTLIWLFLARWMRGETERAAAHYRQLLGRVRQVDHHMTSGIMTITLIPVHLLCGELAEAQAQLLTLHRLKQAVPLLRPWDAVFTGYLRVQNGDLAGLDQMKHGLIEWDNTGTRAGYVQQRLLLLHAYLQAGQLDVGLQTVADIVGQIEQHGLHMYEAEVRRVQGELWRARGDYAQAHVCFQQALAVAQAQGAAMWEQRIRRSQQTLAAA